MATPFHPYSPSSAHCHLTDEQVAARECTKATVADLEQSPEHKRLLSVKSRYRRCAKIAVSFVIVLCLLLCSIGRMVTIATSSGDLIKVRIGLESNLLLVPALKHVSLSPMSALICICNWCIWAQTYLSSNNSNMCLTNRSSSKRQTLQSPHGMAPEVTGAHSNTPEAVRYSPH